MSEKPIMHGHDHRPGGTDPVPGIGTFLSTVGCHLQASTGTLTDGSPAAVAVVTVDYDPQSMCTGVGATFVTVPEDGLYLCVGSASFVNMPVGSVATSAFVNLGGAGHFPVSPESVSTDTAPVLGASTPDPSTTSSCVVPLSSGEEIKFSVEANNIGSSTVSAVAIFSVTKIAEKSS